MQETLPWRCGGRGFPRTLGGSHREECHTDCIPSSWSALGPAVIPLFTVRQVGLIILILQMRN